MEDYPLYMADAFTLSRNPIPPRTITSIPAKQLPSYAGNAEAAADDVRLYLRENYRVVVLAADERRAKVLQEFFSNHDIPAIIYRELEKLPDEGRCAITIGAISAGIEYPGLRLAILTDAQLVRERREKKQRSAKKLPPGAAEDRILRRSLGWGLRRARKPRHRPLCRYREDAGGWL